MKILITGASGAIGRELIPFLLERGHSIWGISRKIIEILHPNFKSIKIDLDKIRIQNDKIFYDESVNIESQFYEELEGIDCIIHLAGTASGEGGSKEEYYLSNYENTSKLVKIAEIKKIPKFIYSSSSSVYGSQKKIIPFTEEDFPEGDTYYAISKILAEGEIRKSRIPDKIILRIGSVFGKNLKSYINKLINYHKKGFIPYPIKKDNYKSFIYIEDLIQYLEKLISYNQSGTFNICYPKPIEFKDIVDAIFRQTDKKSIKIYIPELFFFLEKKIRSLLLKNSEPVLKPLFQGVVMNSDKIIHQLSYKPSTSVEDGIYKIIHS